MSVEATSVAIAPTELGFHRPFTVEVAETLTIRNPNPTPVAFKVKTTAPKQYCVRPNSGRIEPDRSVDVTVLLQAMKQDPPADYKCRDKFLVQSVPITGDKEFISVQEIWDNVEKSSVSEKKIRVSFLPVEGATDPDVATPARAAIPLNEAEATPEVSPPVYASPRDIAKGHSGHGGHGGHSGLNGNSIAAAAVTPSKQEARKVLEQTRAMSPEVSATPSSVDTSPASYAAPAAAFGGAAGLSAVGLSSAVAMGSGSGSDSKDAIIASLKAKLAEAEALVASLQKEGGLRQRKVTSTTGAEVASDSPAATTAELKTAQVSPTIRQGTEGVPVQVVAILCFVCFLLAYLFF